MRLIIKAVEMFRTNSINWGSLFLVLRESTTSVEMIPNTIDSDPTQPLDAAANGTAIQDKESSTHAADDRMSLGEVEEDTMDISRSDVEEAELSLYSPKPLTEDQDILSSTGDGDDENYEPPSEIDINQRQGPDLHTVLNQDLQSAKDDLITITQNRPLADQAAELIERPTSDGPSSTANADKADTERSQQSASRSPFLANASDPDDYEPPEPALLGEEESQPLRMSSVESDKSFSPPDVDTNDNVASTSSQSNPTIHQEVSLNAITVGARSLPLEFIVLRHRCSLKQTRSTSLDRTAEQDILPHTKVL